MLQMLPAVVMVKFDDAKWTMAPLGEEGMYPIEPVSREWFLDTRRVVPVLKVKRRQLPLAPAFAKTAHSAQGCTEKAAIDDLVSPGTANKLTSYVALSRVRSRHDILIFRPFSIDVFRGGPPLGPATLLQQLRGDAVDWAALRARFAPDMKRCMACSKMLAKDSFTVDQWQERCRVCLECPELGLVCNKCGGRFHP